MTKQNNPIAIGALLLILGGAVVFIVRTLGDHGETPVTMILSPAPTNATAAPAAMLPERGLQYASRDPFNHPDLRRLADTIQGTAPEGGASVPAQGNGETGNAPGFVNMPFDANTAQTDQTNAPKKNAPKAAPLKPKPAAGDKTSLPTAPVPSEADFARTLRLTAILGGTTRRAVVEGAGPQPLILNVGEAALGLRLVAINAQEIVLAGKRGLWTIPLQTAASGDAPPETPSSAQKDIGNAKP